MERGEDNMREKLRVESQVVRGSRSYQNCASTRVFFFSFIDKPKFMISTTVEYKEKRSSGLSLKKIYQSSTVHSSKHYLLFAKMSPSDGFFLCIWV